MAYHQGTVWAFPLGGYYLAYLKVHEYSSAAIHKVQDQLTAIEACLREGCVGQIAEIYDGDNPTISQGCYAQAWSVSELLRVYAKLESFVG
jgi:glycogen debranching enzyme